MRVRVCVCVCVRGEGEELGLQNKAPFFRQAVNSVHVLKVSGYKFEQQQKGYANIY